MSNDAVTVYWAPFATQETIHKINLLQSPPKHIWKTFPKKNGNEKINGWGNYRGCKSSLELFKNTYVLFTPQTSTITFTGDTTSPELHSDTINSWYKRGSSFLNTYAADYDFGWVFFADQPLKARFTNPFMHNTESNKHGYFTSGAFDIGRWFRPINLVYHLWENNNTLKVVAGEPAVYVEFDTDKPVVLKQFDLTEEIFQISTQAIGFLRWVRNESLSQRYARFTGSKRDKKLLKLIRENLLE
jgi:hypothetical protein